MKSGLNVQERLKKLCPSVKCLIKNVETTCDVTWSIEENPTREFLNSWTRPPYAAARFQVKGSDKEAISVNVAIVNRIFEGTGSPRRSPTDLLGVAQPLANGIDLYEIRYDLADIKTHLSHLPVADEQKTAMLKK